MKPNPRAILPFALLAAASAFLLSQWRGMPFAQRFLIGCALYGIAGVKAFEYGGVWPLVWLIGICLAIVLPGAYFIGKLFGIWGKKKN